MNTRGLTALVLSASLVGWMAGGCQKKSLDDVDLAYHHSPEGVHEKLQEQKLVLTAPWRPTFGVTRLGLTLLSLTLTAASLYLINTPLQRGACSPEGLETVSTVLTGYEKPLKRFIPPPRPDTPLKRGATESGLSPRDHRQVTGFSGSRILIKPIPGAAPALGAVGNNAKGVVGVAWRVQIMACKFADNSGGAVSDAIACIDFARTNGARIINASWGVYGLSLSLSNALHAARSADIIVVAAAGNDAVDIDLLPYFPASFDLDNIVAVSATTRSDERYSLSNFGAQAVDLAAPGMDIWSTAAGADDAYAIDQGTSLAAAYTSGGCALLRARYPTETAQQIIQRLRAGTDSLSALAGLCVTGGRLNLRKALGSTVPIPARLLPLPLAGSGSFQLQLSGEPERAYVIQVSTNLFDWTPVHTNVTAADGHFVFTDSPPTDPRRAFFRARSAPE